MPKRKKAEIKIPLRTLRLYDQGKELQNNAFYTAAILAYIQFIEQLILVRYLLRLREKDALEAKGEMDRILKIKDKGELTFGKSILITKSALKSEVIDTCHELKEIRNALVAHPFFVVPIDPHNRYKLTFYDVNNYRKIIRRLCKLTENWTVSFEDKARITHFLKVGSPLAKIARIEEEELIIEDIVLCHICSSVKEKVDRLRSKLLLPHDYKTIDEF